MDEDLVDVAVASAARLLVDAHRLTSATERRRAEQLSRLIADEAGTTFLLDLTDRVMRLDDDRLAATVFASVARTAAPVGIVDRVALRAGALLGPRLPAVVMPAVRRRIRQQTRTLVVPAGRSETRAVARLRADGARLNVNVLGEMVLGDNEARRRTAAVLEQLERGDVDYVSVKISSLCAQLNVLAFDDSVRRIAARLRAVFGAAMHHDPPKFVNLDMEEHRDLELTMRAFQLVLDEMPFESLPAGIVLQAYLPESFGALEEIAEWALARHRRTGASVKVRVVKGANLAMERVDAELHGWPQAPYTTKLEVDANYKRMIEFAMQPRFDPAVRLGVASHNLFDVAWAIEQADRLGAADRIEIEMLNGMAPGQARAVMEETGAVLLYTPVVDLADFPSAISYLARRLDENSAPENFLRHASTVEVGDPQWLAEVERFAASVAARRNVSAAPRRTQDRATEQLRFPTGEPFSNTPDTDFSLAKNRAWITRHLDAATVAAAVEVPVVTGAEQVDRTVAVAREAQASWWSRSPADRDAVLHRAAEVMAAARGQTIAMMAVDARKTVAEADVEVSEAIDFARYYAQCAADLAGRGTGRLEPRGVVLVVPPWNFPYAIPAGGVLAALAAGNSVILKPAPQTVRTAWALTEQLWAAGVPRDVLQFVPVDEGEDGRRLVTHPGIDTLVLTGAHETARLFLEWRPDLRLLAETSGKNAIVVTEHADVDLAVADIVRSAFGHAGQKCSAASLAIVVGAMHDRPAFGRKLADATRTLVVGAGTDVRSTVGPLVGAPGDRLLRALTVLEPGERWLVTPEADPNDPTSWRPGVRTGVAPGSWFHLTECFGPVLGVMRADDLDHAIDLQNQVDYGLTGGIHSLEPGEVEHWLERVDVGNAYVNRHITGAVVRRQPFGGWKRSAVGPTAKAGGPDYVTVLGHWRDAGGEDEQHVAAAYRSWWQAHADGDDPSGLRAERNELRYRPLPGPVVLRIDAATAPAQRQRAIAAANAVGAAIEVSTPSEIPECDRVVHVVEDDDRLAAHLHIASRLRLLAPAGARLRRAAHAAGVAVDDDPIAAEPAVELPRWLRAQAISETLHRYGNVRDTSVRR